MVRIGHGYDVHRFDITAPACDIRLGSVNVPSAHPLLAHSDGDVVLHAVCDALLGAIASGDIGEHYPDTDEQWRGANSADLLTDVYSKVQQAGYCLVNLDITIAAQAPRLKEYKPAMVQAIAALLKSPLDSVNVKATTTEKLGFVGRKEGIAVDAVCLIQQVPA